MTTSTVNKKSLAILSTILFAIVCVTTLSNLKSPEGKFKCNGKTSVQLIMISLQQSLAFLTLLFSSEVSTEESKWHYGIVVDAGSSGSRAYLYHWPPKSQPTDLLSIKPLMDSFRQPLVKTVTPGLSSLEKSPDKVFEYLKPLLDFASNHIPEENQAETPLFILATAGMRLIPAEKQDLILSNLFEHISQKYSFYFPEDNLEIISGIQEGIYQWLAINYVLDKFGHDPGQNRSPTVGAIDMGGASMQIAVEVTAQDISKFSTKDKGKVVEVNFSSSHHYKLFVTTFLGYGANEAIARYHRHLILSQLLTPSLVIRGLIPKFPYEDPCLPQGLQENVSLPIDVEHLKYDLKYAALKPSQRLYLQGTGDWQKCYESLTEFVNSGEDYFVPCDKLQCPDNGIKMPPVDLEHKEIYGFSEFWYTMEDIFRMGGHYNFHQFSTAAQAFCSRHWDNQIYPEWQAGKYPNADLERLKTECVKSVWISVALHEGFSFPLDFAHLISAPNTVNSQVVHWTIGALLYRTRMFDPLK